MINRNLSFHSKNVVYIIKCANSNEIYIGCPQALDNRVSLHKSNIELAENRKLYGIQPNHIHIHTHMHKHKHTSASLNTSMYEIKDILTHIKPTHTHKEYVLVYIQNNYID